MAKILKFPERRKPEPEPTCVILSFECPDCATQYVAFFEDEMRAFTCLNCGCEMDIED